MKPDEEERRKYLGVVRMVGLMQELLPNDIPAQGSLLLATAAIMAARTDVTKENFLKVAEDSYDSAHRFFNTSNPELN